MKAVILAGGEGTRLRPLSYNMPKCMVPILNRPLLEHVIDHLREHAIRDIILAVCFMPHHIRGYFGDGKRFGVRLTYSMESSPLGTAGAVKQVEAHLDETFFVLNGDVFTDLDLTQMMHYHREQGAKATIALTPVEDPSLYGLVETEATGRVERFIEKPSPEAITTNMINAGTYIVEPEVLSHIPPGSRFTFERELFPLLLERGDPVYAYPAEAYWMDIGTPEKYQKLHHDLLSGGVAKGFAGERTGQGIWVEEGCDIHPQAELEGPVVIGRDCIIESGVRVRGPSVIGEGCRIGKDSVIEQAILWPKARLGQGVVLRKCVLAEGVSIGDQSRITEGCVLGGNAVVGCDQSLTPGTNILPGEELPSSPKRR